MAREVVTNLAGGCAMDEPRRAERRKERRQMHLDRRRTHIDVMEHVSGGVRAIPVRSRADERPPPNVKARDS